MADIGIRLTTEHDLLVLNELDHIARADSSRQSLIEDATRTRRAWTIEDSKEIVGYGIISHEFFGRSFLELIYIDESKRSKGYGPELISFLEKQSKSVDLFTSTNESNLHMQRVLEKLGYERSGIIHNLDSGDPEIVYVKKGVYT
jgi:ribosomal protein S18 acetylase RimI-like enzyme